MILFGRWTKIWLIIVFLSLSVWAAYWLRSSYLFIFSLILEGQSGYIARQGIAFWAGVTGYHARFLVGIIGASTIALLSSKLEGHKKFNKLLALVIVLEALYFASLLPYSQYILSFRVPRLLLAYSYILQPIVAAPLLFFLAYKIWKYDETPKTNSMWKWVDLTFAGYIITLWSNVTLGRWFDMLYVEGTAFLENITVGTGFFTSVILITLAMVFAVISVFPIFRKQLLKARMYVGISLFLVGLHYIFYTFYNFYVGLSFDWLMLVDVWAIPLLGLGISLIYDKPSRVKKSEKL